MRVAELVPLVKEMALRNYEKGWDVIVECWSDEDIAREIEGCRSLNGARRRLKPFVSVFNEQRSAAQNAEW